MAELRLDRVDFCKIAAHVNCFRALFKGTSVDPVGEWHLRWNPSAGGTWHLVLPTEVVLDLPVAGKYAEWPPAVLLDVDPSDVGVELRPVVTYIGEHLWPIGKPSPFSANGS